MSSSGITLGTAQAVPVDARQARARRIVAALAGALGLAFVVAVGVGAVAIRPDETFGILAKQVGLVDAAAIDPRQEAVLLSIRLPRALLAIVVGAGLAVSGAAMQGLLRNPLADPGLLGVSSGAALAAAATIVMGGPVVASLPPLVRPFALSCAAFAGSLLATLIVWRLSTRARITAVATMLLAGIALNALAGAGTGLFTLVASDPQLRSLTFWTLGSLGGATWSSLGAVALLVMPAVFLLPRMARSLNALLLGESEARYLGVHVEAVKRVIVVVAALAVAATVAAAGMIGFVGLVAPHLVRLLMGADHRRLLPGAGLLGATLLTLADVVARTAISPAEIPIGIVTALVGAPFFLGLLVREPGQGRQR